MSGTAIFDMDKTLTQSGTWSRYMFSVNKMRPLFYLRLPLLAVHAVAYKLGWRTRQSVKEHGLVTLMWASRDRLERAAQKFAEREIRCGLRKHARGVLDQHRNAGHRLVMATAAVDLVAKPIADKLGIDIVICTSLAWSDENRLTGKLSGPNCYGTAKLDLVKAAHEVHDFQSPITSYSDHVSDLPLLQWGEHGVAVNPSRGLASIAAKAGLCVEDWEAETMEQRIR